MTETAPEPPAAEAGPTPLERFGSARRPDRDTARPRPAGASDEVVQALGTLSKALEYVESARGFLYNFHQLSGTADLTLQSAVKELREAGLDDVAEQVDLTLVGRDVVKDLWTFQVIDTYNEQYYEVFKTTEAWARTKCEDIPPHVFEAEMLLTEQGGS